MSDDDNEAPEESFFSKRAQFSPTKNPEELKAAAELISKFEAEKKMAAIYETKPVGQKSRKKKVPSDFEQTVPADTTSDLIAELDATPLSAASRKRLKKLKEDSERDLAIEDAKNSKILSSQTTDVIIADVPEESEVPEKSVLRMTVVYMSEVARFDCEKDKTFVQLFEDVADYFKLKSDEILLCLNDWNIEKSDTPKSLSLTERDILECIPYKADVTSESFIYNENALMISFQSNDMKDKIDMIVSKIEKMKCIMERYSKKRNLPLNELSFQFDGEKLTGEETPEELEMEPGNCIDVSVFAPVAQCSRASNGSPVAGCSYTRDDVLAAGYSYVSDDEVPSYLQNFLIVESDSNDSDVVALD